MSTPAPMQPPCTAAITGMRALSRQVKAVLQRAQVGAEALGAQVRIGFGADDAVRPR